MDKAERAELDAKLAALRHDMQELRDEQLRLNKHAAGQEGNRHAFISAQLRIMRTTERELNSPLLDAMEDDIRNAE